MSLYTNKIVNGEVIPLTADEIAALQARDIARAAAIAAAAPEKQRLADIDGAIKSDAQIAAIKAMSNADFDAWWAANVTNATQAIAVLKRVTRIVIRRLG